MSGTYKATGINLKTSPMGEADRLLTILTEEFGVIQAIAPGSRKHNSSLGGRSGLFVVNNLLVVKGRSFDKVIQAESLESYPGLSQDLSKLTASQYLAELALSQALSDHPQAELLRLLREHLSRIEKLPYPLPCLTHAAFHLLALAGVPPQVHQCCVTQTPIVPALDNPNWNIGFSVIAGGVVQMSELAQVGGDKRMVKKKAKSPIAASAAASTAAFEPRPTPIPKNSELVAQLNAIELSLLQRLSQPDLVPTLMATDETLLQPSSLSSWLSIERVLRHYAQYHLDRPIRSAALIDACFVPAPLPAI
jgi:DNA repair protein RecO (recombination protein O)